MSEIVLTAENFNKEVLQSDIPVLVDFWATWCGPCRMLAPIVQEFAEDNTGNIKVGKVNVDEQPELAAEYKISSIPTLIAFKDGKSVKQTIGYVSKEEIEALFD